MIVKFEKEIVKLDEKENPILDSLGIAEKEIMEVEEKEAEYKHICYHDEENPKPCRRTKLK